MPYTFLTRLHYTQGHILKVISTVAQTLPAKPPSSHYCPVRQGVLSPCPPPHLFLEKNKALFLISIPKPGRVLAMLVRAAFTPQIRGLQKLHQIIEIEHSPSSSLQQ